MARWCFVCDVPVAGEVCGSCGREPTVVEDAPEPEETSSPRRAVPRWAVVALLVTLVVVLLWLEQSAFRLGG